MEFEMVEPSGELVGMPDAIIEKIFAEMIHVRSTDFRLTCRRINDVFSSVMNKKVASGSAYMVLKVSFSNQPGTAREVQLKWGQRDKKPTLVIDPSFCFTKKIMRSSISFHIQFGIIDTIAPFTSDVNSPRYREMKKFIAEECKIQYVGVENPPKDFDYLSLMGLFSENARFCFVGFKFPERLPSEVFEKLHSLIIYSLLWFEITCSIIGKTNVQILHIRAEKALLKRLPFYLQQWEEGARDIEKWEITTELDVSLLTRERSRVNSNGEREFLLVQQVEDVTIVSVSSKSRL